MMALIIATLWIVYVVHAVDTIIVLSATQLIVLSCSSRGASVLPIAKPQLLSVMLQYNRDFR